MEASGPLVARWRTLERAPVEAGTLQHATVEAENAGSAAWRTRGSEEGLFLAFHWLDERGNAIVWDGTRTPLEREIAPGETLRQSFALRGPIPPGRYKLAVDLVEEHRFWLSELGNRPLQRDIEVVARDASAARAFLPDRRQALMAAIMFGATPICFWYSVSAGTDMTAALMAALGSVAGSSARPTPRRAATSARASTAGRSAIARARQGIASAMAAAPIDGCDGAITTAAAMAIDHASAITSAEKWARLRGSFTA